MAEQHKTTCNRDCPDACRIVATVEDGKITHLAGDPNHPVTQGFLCYRTAHFLPLQYGNERLRQPLLRKNGVLVPVTMDEALDVAAERLLKIRRESGPAAIFHYRSGGSLGLMKHLCDFFFERFGPCTTKSGDICSGAGDAAQETDFGVEDSNDLFDLENARHILLWGKNVFTSSPHTIPVLKRAQANGAKVVLIDPVHHKTAELADVFIQPRPAGDFALAMAVAHVLFSRNWVEERALARCDNVGEFRSMVQSKSLEAWCQEADVDVASAVSLAQRLGPGKPTAILVGWGMGRRLNGGAIVRALDALGAISGNLGIPGGGVSFYFRRREAYDTSFVVGKKAAPRTVNEVLFGREILAAKDPPIRAVWITAGNPVVMLPESQTSVAALESREFVVVVDPFLTDTAKLAHLVLPTATFLEDHDLLGAYGHHYMGVARPVVPPPDGVLTDFEIMQSLAARVGLGTALSGSSRSWQARMVAPKLGPQGITLDDIEKQPLRNPRAPKIMFADGKFATPSGKVNLMKAPPADAKPGEPEFPLMLLSLSTADSQSSQWTRKLDGPAKVTIHPDAAPVADGALAKLESPIGSIVVEVRHDPKQRPDVAIIPKGGGLGAGRCANTLVRARLTDIGEGGALYDERVRLVPM